MSGLHDLVRRVWPDTDMESGSHGNAFYDHNGQRFENYGILQPNVVLFPNQRIYGPHQVRVPMKTFISNVLCFLGGVIIGLAMNDELKSCVKSLILGPGNDRSSNEEINSAYNSNLEQIPEPENN